MAHRLREAQTMSLSKGCAAPRKMNATLLFLHLDERRMNTRFRPASCGRA